MEMVDIGTSMTHALYWLTAIVLGAALLYYIVLRPLGRLVALIGYRVLAPVRMRSAQRRHDRKE